MKLHRIFLLASIAAIPVAVFLIATQFMPESVVESSATTSPSGRLSLSGSTSSTKVSANSASAVTIVTQNYGVGISLGDTLFAKSSDQIDTEFAGIESMGIGWVRLDLDWEEVQPATSTQYDWLQFDTIVDLASAHHLKLLPVLAYTPKWARSSGCSSDKCPPTDMNDYAAFAAAAAGRYASQGIDAWEIWNEPNSKVFWRPYPNAARYASMLEAAYAAIKEANGSAIVISGGLATASDDGSTIGPVAFLDSLYGDGAGGSFDAVGMHPYTYPAYPSSLSASNAWRQMADTSPSIESEMAKNGDSGKKIWITEYGAPTGGPGSVSEAAQSKMLVQAVRSKEANGWAGPIFIYSYQDLGTSQSTVENFFGVLRADGSQKPSYETIKSAIASSSAIQ